MKTDDKLKLLARDILALVAYYDPTNSEYWGYDTAMESDEIEKRAIEILTEAIKDGFI